MKILYTVIMTVALLILGCSSGPTLTPQQALEQNFQVLRDAAMKTIADESRMNQFLGHSRRLESVLIEYNQAFTRFAEQMAELNRNYHTPRSEQEALLADFTDRRKTTMQQVIDLHFEMVAMTTEKEWKKIVKYETEALESMRQLPEQQLGADS